MIPYVYSFLSADIGVDCGCPSRGENTGRQTSDDKHGRNRRECKRVDRFSLIKETREHPRERRGANDAQHQANHHEDESLPHHHGQD